MVSAAPVGAALASAVVRDWAEVVAEVVVGVAAGVAAGAAAGAAAGVAPVAGAELEAGAAPADCLVVHHHARALAHRALAAGQCGGRRDHPRSQDSGKAAGWMVSCRC